MSIDEETDEKPSVISPDQALEDYHYARLCEQKLREFQLGNVPDYVVEKFNTAIQDNMTEDGTCEIKFDRYEESGDLIDHDLRLYRSELSELAVRAGWTSLCASNSITLMVTAVEKLQGETIEIKPQPTFCRSGCGYRASDYGAGLHASGLCSGCEGGPL